ncbi:hypothetical protein FN846DRAFT_993895 [Sphaerosporella brunnea]|uniref:Uncharacterized protein n=1 Tax=Sphaerosporella brunnea TaxID=1250544 RepID=A0A5J5EM87_9PEZI|nr:hypothetical protein FN846DRAFT_993895 [Sphaerosporella brunnea]
MVTGATASAESTAVRPLSNTQTESLIQRVLNETFGGQYNLPANSESFSTSEAAFEAVQRFAFSAGFAVVETQKELYRRVYSCTFIQHRAAKIPYSKHLQALPPDARPMKASEYYNIAYDKFKKAANQPRHIYDEMLRALDDAGIRFPPPPKADPRALLAKRQRHGKSSARLPLGVELAEADAKRRKQDASADSEVPTVSMVDHSTVDVPGLRRSSRQQ